MDCNRAGRGFSNGVIVFCCGVSLMGCDVCVCVGLGGTKKWGDGVIEDRLGMLNKQLRIVEDDARGNGTSALGERGGLWV